MRRMLTVGVGLSTSLALAGCATNAPQDTFQPKGPNAQMIDDLQKPVFAVAGIIGVIVTAAVVYAIFKFRDRGQRFFGGTHRVGACSPKDRAMRLGDAAHGGRVAQPCADRDHARDTRSRRARDHLGQFPRKAVEVEMAMAIDDLWSAIGHGAILLRVRRRARSRPAG